MDNCITYLGLVKKAGYLQIGEDCVSNAVMDIKARLLLSASDASDASKRKAGFMAEDIRVPHIILPYTKADLGLAVGRGVPGMLCICDTAMAKNFVDKLTALYPQYKQTGEILAVKLKRANERRMNKKQEKNNTNGKRRTK